MDLAELVVGIIPILIIGYLIRLIKYTVIKQQGALTQQIE